MENIFFVFLVLTFSSCFEVSLSATDESVLLDFRDNLVPYPNNILTYNWTRTTSFCNWIGVTCNTETQRVTSLNLSNLNLEGTMSPSIANLSFLLELDISNNNLRGSIPPSIFNVSSLRTLNLTNNNLSGAILLDQDEKFVNDVDNLEVIDLSYNQLLGEVPSSLCRFRQLKMLDLSYNNITSRIPKNIGCLTKLERLYMTKNMLSGPIPPSIGNLSSLQFLDCAENRLSGRAPDELGKLVRLRMLGFDYNNLTGEIPLSIFNLSSLVYIAFRDNNLSGRLPATLGLRLPNLEGIYLVDNMLEGEFPLSIINASKLKELDLSYNYFTGYVPYNFGNLRDLRFLNVAGNRLTNEPTNGELTFMNSLVECRMLEFVVLGNNPLRGFLPKSVMNLSSSIQTFNIENGEVFGRIPSGIGNMTTMLSLVLNGNNLTGDIPSETGYLKQLQRLYLSKNNLEGRIPVELCDLVDLGDVILSENNLSGSIPTCIGNLSTLRNLMLGYNRLTSSLPSTLWDVKNIWSLNVSQNSLQGEISREIQNLDGVERLDLSSNEFSGSIPSSLGDLQTVRYLSLSNNSLEGSIPLSFGNLISLELLDLSSNGLSGTIPTSLEGLMYLKEINLSNNGLQGSIPSGGVFANSSSQSYAGNKGLCSTVILEFSRCPRGSSRSKTRVLQISIPITVSVALMIILLTFSIWYGRKKVKLVDSKVMEISTHKLVQYRELVQATDNFSESNLLGIGSSGSVFKGILSDGNLVAIKVLNLKDKEICKSFDTECNVRRRMRHRNLVKVITTCSNEYVRAIVLQYMPNGNLDHWLHQKDIVLDLLRRIDIMLDVAMAIEYLHHGCDDQVVHCDLKPANVLLDADMVAHVSDFGISKILAQDMSNARTSTLGTIGYIAPEYGSQGLVSTAGDIYSFGILLLETMTGKRPTDEMFSENFSMKEWITRSYPNSLIEIVDSNLFEEEDEVNTRHKICISFIIELALDCSKVAPEERINMKEAVTRLGNIRKKFSETN